MIDFSTLQGLTIPEGVVTQIADASGRVIWALPVADGPIILEVEKITSDTYAGETTYSGEQFILLDIYPTTNGTVTVTYGGLTKTITDTSGAEEPNAQQVFFGTFNGVSDSVVTPSSGELTIEGDCQAFGCSQFSYGSKDTTMFNGVNVIKSFGAVKAIPGMAFGHLFYPSCNITEVKIPGTVLTIGNSAFGGCKNLAKVILREGTKSIDAFAFSGTLASEVTIPKSVEHIHESAFVSKHLKKITILSTIPFDISSVINSSTGEVSYIAFGDITAESFGLEQIIVPKGFGNTYKTAEGWNYYADYIVEAT